MGILTRDLIVQDHQRGLLYEDGVFKRLVEPGKHRLKRHPLDRTRREITLVDIRERSETIKGQEILTADKVAIRVSILVHFRVVDPAAAVHNVASYQERIYEDVQLATRRYLASRTLEAILQDRNEISDSVREDVRGAASSYGVEILRADVKDLVFPGNLREIMNRVLETERQSEAMLIEAQKKTEALLVTARGEREAMENRIETDLRMAQLLAEHPGLLHLKQLEVLREIAGRPGNSFYIGMDPFLDRNTTRSE